MAGKPGWHALIFGLEAGCGRYGLANFGATRDSCGRFGFRRGAKRSFKRKR
jgi:hypothetical protein